MRDAGELIPRALAAFEPVERHGAGTGWNRLFHGDNLAALQWLCESGAGGTVDLVYIDPPYASGVDYASSPNEGARVSREAYRDTWAGGVPGYLAMLRPRLELIRDLLAPDGSVFVHVGWQVNAHVRLVLDDIFGADRFVDEIIWHYQTSSGAPAAALIKNHATIYHYAKGAEWTFNQVREPWPEATLRKWQRDEEGRIYRVQNRFGKRYYIDPSGKRIDDVWEFTLASRSHERTLYPTQKPEALLDRIIRMASREGDLVADFFCGSGTTLAAAEKLGRRWIGCDAGDLATQTTRRRLLGIPGRNGFEILAPRPEQAEEVAGLGAGPRIRARVDVDDAGRPVAILEGLSYERPDLVPARFRERAAAPGSDWADFLDEWAVDWDFDGAVLQPAWSAFRTRKERGLILRSEPLAGTPRRIRIRAVDIFGENVVWEAAVPAGTAP